MDQNEYDEEEFELPDLWFQAFQPGQNAHRIFRRKPLKRRKILSP